MGVRRRRVHHSQLHRVLPRGAVVEEGRQVQAVPPVLVEIPVQQHRLPAVQNRPGGEGGAADGPAVLDGHAGPLHGEADGVPGPSPDPAVFEAVQVSPLLRRIRPEPGQDRAGLPNGQPPGTLAGVARLRRREGRLLLRHVRLRPHPLQKGDDLPGDEPVAEVGGVEAVSGEAVPGELSVQHPPVDGIPHADMGQAVPAAQLIVAVLVRIAGVVVDVVQQHHRRGGGTGQYLPQDPLVGLPPQGVANVVDTEVHHHEVRAVHQQVLPRPGGAEVGAGAPNPGVDVVEPGPGEGLLPPAEHPVCVTALVNRGGTALGDGSAEESQGQLPALPGRAQAALQAREIRLSHIIPGSPRPGCRPSGPGGRPGSPAWRSGRRRSSWWRRSPSGAPAMSRRRRPDFRR